MMLDNLSKSSDLHT